MMFALPRARHPMYSVELSIGGTKRLVLAPVHAKAL